MGLDLKKGHTCLQEKVNEVSVDDRPVTCMHGLGLFDVVYLLLPDNEISSIVPVVLVATSMSTLH